MEKNKSIYPCTACSKEVTDKRDCTGEGLQCSICSRFFHNTCMAKPVSKGLYAALKDSPDYIQVLCPGCLNNSRSMDRLSEDVAAMKKNMKQVTYANTVSGELVGNVKKAVVSMEKSNKSSEGLLKILPKTLPRQSPETNKRIREEKMTRVLVVLKPSANVSTSHSIRKEFNTKFPDIALRAAISTPSGSVKLEFETNDIREDVAARWPQSLFGGNKGVKKPTPEPTVGIIKQVDVTDSTEDIIEDIQTASPGAEADFFRRNGSLTGTIKLIFTDHEAYKQVMEKGGIHICGGKYRMEQFISKPKVIRCFKCQAYGHISFFCRAKDSRCGKCCGEGHESKDCTAEIKKPACYHCKGSHYTGSKICPEFQKVEEKISNNQFNHGF